MARSAIFNDVFFKKPQFSKFDKSYEKLVNFNAGQAIPLGWEECLPNSYYNVGVSGIVRMSALSSPMFQRQTARIRLFIIPYNALLCEEDIERAFTGGESGTDKIDFPMSKAQAKDMRIGTLYDYLDLPLPYRFNDQTESWDFYGQDAVNPDISPIPFLAYHRVYNDFYRNEETENQVTQGNTYLGFHSNFDMFEGLSLGTCLQDYNGINLYSLDHIHNIGWPRDYFTSALKSTQRGNQVMIPVLGSAPVTINTANTGSSGSGQNGQPITVGTGLERSLTVNGAQTVLHGTADMSEVSGIGAIALRLAMNMQAFLEKDNLAGYRLSEHILAHYAIQVQDFRLKQAKYIGGCQFPIRIIPVTQTSSNVEGQALGSLAGQGEGVVNSHLGRILVRDHSIIVPILTITPDVSMGNQGLDKRWTRRTSFDYAYPEFQDVGEQEILNREVFYDFDNDTFDGQNNEVWAYQYRYAEYMYNPNRINGDFRTSLSFWHQARLFNSLPSFNDDFIKCIPSDRIFAIDDTITTRHYWGWFYIKMTGIEPLKKFPSHKTF